MDKRKEIEQERHEINRLVGVAHAWVYINRKMVSARADTEIVFKSFSVKLSSPSSNAYQQSYFVILRASYGQRDMVKFRQLSDLLNLSHVLSDMIRSEKGWRDDKYGMNNNDLP